MNSVKKFEIFMVRRIHGWWQFKKKIENVAPGAQNQQKGKIEAPLLGYLQVTRSEKIDEP